MGCASSTSSVFEYSGSACWRDGEVTRTLTTYNLNEVQVDISHFSRGSVVLGLGGFGVVRLVRKVSGPDRGMEYAMKSMSKAAIVKRSSGPAAVITELRALVILQNCRHICQIQYAFQSDSHLYMVLDLARRGDLRHSLRASPNARFSEKTAMHIFRQLLEALHCCHVQSILHRDIKPENILMTDTGLVKLSDFGVAKILPDLQDCRSTSGTHGYMAPEIYVGNHSHGTPSEWFSAGVTLHELLTGRRPFEAARLQAFRNSRSAALFSTSAPHTPKTAAAGTAIAGLQPEYLEQCDFLSASCKDLIRSLLVADPRLRLGAVLPAGGVGVGGIADIATHAWLQNWGCGCDGIGNWDWDWDLVPSQSSNGASSSEETKEEAGSAAAGRRTKAAAATSAAPAVSREDLCSDDWVASLPFVRLPILMDSRTESKQLQPQPQKQQREGNDMSRDDLARAVQEHLQATPVSPAEQARFSEYGYRQKLVQG